MPISPPHIKDKLREEMRLRAQDIFKAGLAEATVDRAFQRHISCERGILRICEDVYDLSSYRHVLVISIGKAAHTMLEALQERAGNRFEGIVVGPPSTSHLRGFRYFEGGHPLPSSESIRAADAILKTLLAQTADSLVIYLISGGGSSMVEKPIDDEISLEDVRATYSALVHSSAAIAEINAVRKHLSTIKGGRMALAASPAQQVSVFVSDVPDNTPDALASGPTMPDSTTAKDCYAIATKHKLLEGFPPSVRELFERRALEETPKSDDPTFHNCRWWTLLSNKYLLGAAKAEAEQKGFHTVIDNTCDDWDYERAVTYLLGRLHELRDKSQRVCLLSGGEVTVKTAGNGVGGRNQQFALACASKIDDKNITVLSAGTDGTDGNSLAAGALVDGTTMNRAKSLRLSVENHLLNFNAYPLFEKIGDLITTGPTGNNLRDLRIFLAY